ncbi:MAG: protein phosphatase 2C domain-containing protein [Cyanobacteriota bacterium]|nr:protein phosphatase 2C domain-containing protein [Cyanobacteriota bacterium]
MKMLIDRGSDRPSNSSDQRRRYLWAIGELAAKIPPSQTISDRYRVVAPQVWLDTQPHLPPQFPDPIPEEILPYLHLYPLKRHVPIVFGTCQWADRGAEVLLLENAPIDDRGNLYPTLSQCWSTATPARRAYWLWQLLQLWTPLDKVGMAASLLDENNIRVQGWRVWLLELHPSTFKHSLKDLGRMWSTLVSDAGEELEEFLRDICQQMRDGIKIETIVSQLNGMLLESAARLPLHVRVSGATETGPVRNKNEDACYPTPSDLRAKQESPNDELLPNLAILCDGVGGHEGGEVASQMTVQALKLQIRAFLNEMARESTLIPPEAISDQLAAIVRVVNNIVAAQNDAQDRESRQRMGTTLVMALQVAQLVRTQTGEVLDNAHELYLTHVGDSRAYWITREYCVQLTVDDDAIAREVRSGRSFYYQARQQKHSGALTQALGTRDGDLLRPTISRFILEEDGVLLLCSDGLSDRDGVERYWSRFVPAILDDELDLDVAVQEWIQLANETNGHDNTSIVLTRYRVSKLPTDKVRLFEPSDRTAQLDRPESEMSEASKVLLYDRAEPSRPRRRRPNPPAWMTVVGVLAALALSGAIGWLAMSQLKPDRNAPEPVAPTPSLPPAEQE